MNKRITSILLCFVMLFCMSVSAVPTYAVGSSQLKVTANKTTANPGDTVDFAVSIGAVDNLGILEFQLKIPNGLTIMESSVTLPDGIEETLDSDGAIVKPWSGSNWFWRYSAQSLGYTGASDLVLVTFSCTVDNDCALGNKTITVEVESFYDNDIDEITYSIVPVTVAIEAAPVPATGITLNKSTLELTVGSSETLVATVEPVDTTDTVTWDTGRSDVATVDSTGKVTAVAPGTAVIAARAGEKSAFCTVTVVAAPCTHTNRTNVSAKTSTCEEKGWEAYSKCNDCGQLFDKDGNEISAIPYLPLADHTPAQTATSEYLKSAANCTSAAVYYEHCSVCGEKLITTFTSGTALGHTESDWKSDADGHWKECTVCGTVTTIKASHTPDHEGHATEAYAIKCSACGYEIEAQLGHTHNMTPVAANPATCTEDGNKAYYVCSGCSKWFEDATGSVEITDHSSVVLDKLGHDWVAATCTTPKACSRCDVTEGTALGHDWADVWSSDADGHWHACSRCDAKADEAAHTPDRGAATETDPIKCSECDYTITPALGLQEYFVNMPVIVTVKLTGDEKPAKETFEFEIYDLGCEDTEFEIVDNSLTVENLEFDDDGLAFVECIIRIKLLGEEQLCNITEGFKVRMVKGSTKGWTYAPEQWCVEPAFENDNLDLIISVREIVDDEISEDYANGMSFTVSYEAVNEPGTSEPGASEPGDSQNPQTGENSMMGLWIALLFVSGAGVAAITIYDRKRFSVK